LTGYLLRRAQLAVFDDFIKLFEPLGLRPAQFSALVVIDRNPGRKQSEIAQALGIRQTNLVGLIDELERRGLTRRKRLATDRRSHAVSLTPKGAALLKKALKLHDQHEFALLSRLGRRENEQLLALLTALLSVLGPESRTVRAGVDEDDRQSRHAATA
jgi:DNA-binding MarR family transcriptional regulator